MGSILGKITVETPKHEVLTSTNDYEIRKYPPSIIAQVTTTYENDPSQKKPDKDSAFTVLANYIGALGNANNTKSQKIAMTAPVITHTDQSEKIDMTAPVITKGENLGGREVITMQFILPCKYVKVEDVPKPLDERVVIKEEGERKYGVVTFSGVASDDVVHEKVTKLKDCLIRDGYRLVGEGDYLLARYNPPWTLPMLRTNEVMVPIE